MLIPKIGNALVKNLRSSICYAKRSMSDSSNIVVKSLVYNQYGEPADVLCISSDCLGTLSDNEVAVKWLYAPVNPADINTIQGKYPSKPPLPAVPGNEGVGEIVAIGQNIKSFNVGDKIVPNGVNKGTWRSHAIYKYNEVYKINPKMNLVAASMLNVNPCTAYRMLKDFVEVGNNDTVIQNGGNSAVGQFVIQLCKVWGINTVNIVRDRPDIKQLKSYLKELGATEVLTEEELRTTDIFKKGCLAKPRLALNCVSGKNALEVQRHLDRDGVMVTYGGMSREPLTAPVSSLIFKNISFVGFWMTAWTNKNGDSEERHSMFKDLQEYFINNNLKVPPHQLVEFGNYKTAVTSALSQTGKSGIKYILDLTSD